SSLLEPPGCGAAKMPTKRTPKNRAARRQITPAAVAAYAAGDANELHRLLGLKPCEANPLDAGGACPYSDGTAAAFALPQEKALRDRLKQAAMDVRFRG